jgi:hypothetical protein
MNAIPASDASEGCLLGCAVGDSIGLPYEGLSARRARRFVRLPLRHRFAFGRGMVSDDTDHSVFVAQALIRSGGEPEGFRRALSWRLRLWLLCLPAGIGWATLRSILRMWLGLRNSGVWSAGNGPAMRSGIIGAALHSDPERRRALVAVSTRLTHTDPRALAGALAIAEVTSRLASGAWVRQPPTAELAALLHEVSPRSRLAGLRRCHRHGLRCARSGRYGPVGVWRTQRHIRLRTAQRTRRLPARCPARPCRPVRSAPWPCRNRVRRDPPPRARCLRRRTSSLPACRGRARIDQEAGAACHRQRQLVERRDEGGRCALHGDGIAGGAAHHFDQRHLRHRVEEMDADQPRRILQRAAMSSMRRLEVLVAISASGLARPRCRGTAPASRRGLRRWLR